MITQRNIPFVHGDNYCTKMRLHHIISNKLVVMVFQSSKLNTMVQQISRGLESRRYDSITPQLQKKQHFCTMEATH